MIKKDTPTIYTVAEKAGVSIATVSRVLSNSDKVRPETRASIQRAMEELGYHPNLAARKLAFKTTGTIALIFPDISGPYYSMVISGVDQEADRQDYSVLIYGMHGKKTSRNGFLQVLSSKVDGFIIMTRTVDENRLLNLHRQGIVFVLLGQRCESFDCDSVMVDNRAGAYNAVVHLLSHGHRRIAFVGGPEDSHAHLERYEGYQEAIQHAGLKIDPELVATGNFLYQGGRSAAQQLLSLPHPPSAIFAGNDEMAIGAIDEARNLGCKIPEQLAIIGFDDIQTAAFTNPGLTTVRQPMKRLGEVAADLLLYRLKERETPLRHEVLSTELVVRQTCGCTRG
jgi:DNA-binding LacI/PurR family transcriptional regulator